jgi:hypothetical protein
MKNILKDIRYNSVSFHGGKDILRALFHNTGFNIGKYDK